MEYLNSQSFGAKYVEK